MKDKMDAELVQLAKAGNQDAFSSLYARYLPYVRSIVSRTMYQHQEEIEDVVQSTFMRAFTHLDQFSGDSLFRTWVHRIAINHSIETLRARRHTPTAQTVDSIIETMDGNFVAFDIPGNDRCIQAHDAKADIERILLYLHPREQLFIRLRYIEGFKSVEIAERYGLINETVKSIVFRGMRTARERMEQKPIVKDPPAAKDVKCDYCKGPTQWLPDSAVYPRSYGGMVYVCIGCKAWVGCHRRKDGQPGNHPLGRLADAELRRLKIRGHALFDRFWKAAVELRGWSKKKARASAYKWLSAETGIPPKEMHFGMLDNEQCAKAIAVLEALYAKIAAKRETDGTRHHPLERAYLCADCNRVGSNARECPSCASQHGLLSLSSILNRPESPMLVSSSHMIAVLDETLNQ